MSAMTPVELQTFLGRFQQMRFSMRESRKASERIRQHRLEVNRYALSRDDAARRALIRPAMHGGVTSYFGYRPNYSATVNFAYPKRIGGYGRGGRWPLITSLGVARFFVWRSFW
jgi:hypothetical protein